jgi:hypothetical protein
MPVKTRRVHRILAIERQLQRVQEWKLAELRRNLAALEASQQDLIRALDDDDALQGLFIDALARRLRSLGEEASRVGRETEDQAVLLLQHSARMLCAERLADAVNREAERSNEKGRLLEVIERVAGATAQASRKIAEG